MEDGDVLGPALKAGSSGDSNHSRVNPSWSIRLMIATQKPSNSRFLFQYAARTLAPTRRVSRAVALFGLPLGGSAGIAREGPNELGLAAPMFMFCSDVGFVVAATALSGLDESEALAPLRTCSSIRR